MWAAATAISCFVLAGSAPSANTSSLNAWNAAWMAGASSRRLPTISSMLADILTPTWRSLLRLLNLQRSPDFLAGLRMSLGGLSFLTHQIHFADGNPLILTDGTTVPCGCGKSRDRLECWFGRGSPTGGHPSKRLEQFALHGVRDCLQAVVSVKFLIDVV